MKQFAYFKTKFELAIFIEKLALRIGYDHFRNVVPFVNDYSRAELELMLIDLFSNI